MIENKIEKCIWYFHLSLNFKKFRGSFMNMYPVNLFNHLHNCSSWLFRKYWRKRSICYYWENSRSYQVWEAIQNAQMLTFFNHIKVACEVKGLLI